MHLYLYDDEAQKERLMGARHTLFTRPWIPEIHTLSADLGLLNISLGDGESLGRRQQVLDHRHNAGRGGRHAEQPTCRLRGDDH